MKSEIRIECEFVFKMLTRILVVFNLLFIFNGKLTLQQCDKSQNLNLRQGNLGQVGMFPWLGLLRVHLHQGAQVKIALTGLVLVKENYAIANADDIVRIPRAILKADSKAMFILKDEETWTCKVKDYMTHPEYEYSTYNTIAIVEFQVEENEEFPVTPICWLLKNYNASSDLYAIGYTDENQLLEKTLHSMEYLSRSDCEEFYSRSGLIEEKHAPSHYHCSFSRSNKEHCVWENGMALVSNNTGTGSWKLIGFGIRGPGCAAPARFIDLTHYYHWIHSSTSMDYAIYRRKSAFREGSKENEEKGDFDEVPAHELFRETKAVSMFHDPYLIDDVVTFDRLGRDAVSIAFHDKYEKEKGNCKAWKKRLIYKEQMEIKTNIRRFSNVVKFQIALYDLYLFEYNCVTLKINSLSREKAYVWYKLQLSAPSRYSNTPMDIIKHYHFNTTATKPPSTEDDDPSVPPGKMYPKFLTDPEYVKKISNINLYVKYRFFVNATFKLEVFGLGAPHEEKEKHSRRTNEIPRFEKFKRKTLRLGNNRKLVNDSLVSYSEMLKSKTNCNESVKNYFTLVFTVQFVFLYEKYFCKL